jgi:hypothetical protein
MIFVLLDVKDITCFEIYFICISVIVRKTVDILRVIFVSSTAMNSIMRKENHEFLHIYKLIIDSGLLCNIFKSSGLNPFTTKILLWIFRPFLNYFTSVLFCKV